MHFSREKNQVKISEKACYNLDQFVLKQRLPSIPSYVFLPLKENILYYVFSSTHIQLSLWNRHRTSDTYNS